MAGFGEIGITRSQARGEAARCAASNSESCRGAAAPTLETYIIQEA